MLRYAMAFFLAGLAAAACGGSQSGAAEPLSAEASEVAGRWTAERAHSEANDISPETLAAGIAAGSHVAVDVNSEQTRMEFGVVPGAVLMDGADDLDAVIGQTDRELVFYCGSPSCMAAPAAAANAMNAGVSGVSIMSAGIRGWVASGQEVEPYAGTATDASMATISVSDAAAAIDAGRAQAVDANNEDTREEWGTLPGAVLLSSYDDFDRNELPESLETALVFYCFNTSCSAAPQAALRAMEMGFHDVRVMEAGIQGWRSMLEEQ